MTALSTPSVSHSTAGDTTVRFEVEIVNGCNDSAHDLPGFAEHRSLAPVMATACDHPACRGVLAARGGVPHGSRARNHVSRGLAHHRNVALRVDLRSNGSLNS